MFVGHLAVSFAGKRAHPGTSLVWFVAAANFVDLIWPVFLLLGLETVRIDPGNTAFTPLDFVSYPWTHSLLMTVVWGAALGAFARWRGVSPRASLWVGAVVVSHWVLDFVTHRPDLLLVPWGGPRVGLGLWHSVPGTFAVESVLWLAGIAAWLSVRRPARIWGQLAFWSFVIVSTLLWASGPFGAPPPDEHALAMFAMLGWIILPWTWWVERMSVVRDAA